MTERKPYRDSGDPLTPEQEASRRPSAAPSAPSEPAVQGEPSQAPKEQEGDSLAELEVVTAFVIVLTKDGRAIPMTDVGNMEMDHMATPGDVLRCCLDVANQIGVNRMMADTTVIQHKLNQQLVNGMERALHTLTQTMAQAIRAERPLLIQLLLDTLSGKIKQKG